MRQDDLQSLMGHYFEIAFSDQTDIVYLICVVLGEEICPIYIGESTRSIGRLGDYVKPNFTAPTDFKVGEAIKHIRDTGYEVKFFYKYTNNNQRTIEEKRLINKIGAKFRLLNYLEGYDYRIALKSEERKKIQDFTDNLLNDCKNKLR